MARKAGTFYTILLTFLGVVTILNVLAFVQGHDVLHRLMPPYTHVLLLTIGTVYLFRGFQIIGALLWTKVFRCNDPPTPLTRENAYLPVVSIQIPVRNEPLEVARHAIDAAFGVDYPAEKLQIQVIDNSDTEDMALPVKRYLETKTSQPTDRGGPPPEAVFIHREGTQGFKARNLNIGLGTAKGEIILVLDADSWVPDNALLSALPYFEADPRLGYLQLRIDPLNEQQNIISAVAGTMARARYKVMAMRDSQGVVQFDGHNGFFRRGVLEAVGGWSEQLSEDLATSIKVLLAGYRARYADLPSGEFVPATLRELVRQRKRWAMGTMQCLMRDAPAILASTRLRWFEKLDLLFSVLYIVLEALICALLFTFAPLPVMSVLLVLVVFSLLPTYLVGDSGVWKAFPRQLSMVLIVSALLPALLQGILAGMLSREHRFDVTRKDKVGRGTVGELLGAHGFGLAAAALFFGIGAWLTESPAEFFNNYLAGTIVMGSALLVPIVFQFLGSGRGNGAG